MVGTSAVRVNGVELHWEERGSGEAILGVHGTGGSSALWADPAERLSDLGRVITYDRRGWSRSERPAHYERTSVAEHARDAAALLRALGAAPAVVVGRSYGGEIALELAMAHPDCVRAAAVLEGPVLGLSPAADAWLTASADRVVAAAEREGPAAAARALFDDVLGAGGWDGLPAAIRDAAAANGPAIAAECRGGELRTTVERLGTIGCPVLLVTGAGSPAPLREVTALIAGAIPGARLVTVPGGHLIDPAGEEVRAFVAEILR